jgi:Helix-hairpin-helix domain
MGIFKRVFDSIAGKPDVAARLSTSRNYDSIGHSDSVGFSSTQALPSFSSETALSASTEPISGITQAPPSVIFQPVADPAEDTNSFFEEVAEAFDNAFETVCSENAELNTSMIETTRDEQAEAAVQELFIQIAANYATPLKGFMFELQRGTASKNEIELCRPILDGIRGAVEIMNLPQAIQRISDLDDALLLALSSNERLVNGAIRLRILSSYEALVRIIPEAFRLGDEGEKREDIIIKSLLKQIPGVGCVTLEKLYRAGLGSLDALFLANKEDLAAATGVSGRICELICDKVAQHRQELGTLPDDAAQSVWRGRLAAVANSLRDEIDAARAPNGSPAWPTSEEQRRRNQRQLYFLKITVILAEMGELELLGQMHKVSFKRRIQILDEYLARPEATV